MKKIINKYFYYYKNKLKFLIIIFFIGSTLSISAEKYYLKNNWFYSLSNTSSSWKIIDITKSLEEQGIILKKGDYIFLKTMIDLKDIKQQFGDNSELGIYFGKSKVLQIFI